MLYTYCITDQKPDQDIAIDPRSDPEPKHDGLTTPVEKENKRIVVPEHVEPEPPKRGFLSQFFLLKELFTLAKQSRGTLYKK